MNLSNNEIKVLKALMINWAGDTDLDCGPAWFSVLEDVNVEGMTRQELGGYITQLNKKGLVKVYLDDDYERGELTILTFLESTVKPLFNEEEMPYVLKKRA